MENKIEMLKQVSDLINTLTFIQSSMLEGDDLRVGIFINHASKELSYIKNDHRKNMEKTEQTNTK